MDFFDEEAHAQKQTRRLIWLFGLAVLAFVVFAYFILAVPILLFFEPLKNGSDGFFNWIWDARIAFWVAVTTLIPVSLGCLYKFRLLAGGGSAVAEMLGGRKIDGNPSDLNEKQLRDVVEEMAVASQMSVPEIYVLDRERGINSFAAGYTREDVAIGVTLGAMKLLTRDELQGVVAHEFSHVLNGDTRLNMKLMALAHGLSWPTILGRILIHGSTQAPEIGESIFDKEDRPVFLPTAPIGILFLIMGAVSLPFVRALKSAICREREWLADSSAVQFTRNPAGISGALKKIGGLYKAARLDSPFAETASHLYFADSDFEPWLDFMATHPPLEKRISAIDPYFDGQFQHINSLPREKKDDSQEVKLDNLYEENVRRAREEAKLREESE